MGKRRAQDLAGEPDSLYDFSPVDPRDWLTRFLILVQTIFHTWKRCYGLVSQLQLQNLIGETYAI